MRRVICVVVWLLSLSIPARAATYYVATTGSNGNSGAIGSPWLTIAYAMADAQVNCGDTIYVRAGTYASIDTQAAPALTCASFASPLTVSAYTGETVSMVGIGVYAERYLIFTKGSGTWNLTGQPNGTAGETISIGGGYSPSAMGGGYIRFVGLDIHGGNTTFFGTPGSPSSNPNVFYGDGATVVSFSSGSVGGNEIVGGTIHDSASYGSTEMATAIAVYNATGGRRPAMAHAVYVESPNNLVDGVEIYHITHYAIHNVFGNSSTNVYRNNHIHHNGTADVTMFAVYLGTGDSNLAYNNVIHHNVNGIQSGGTNNAFYNNTIAYNGINSSCGTQCYGAGVLSGTGTLVKNNIVYGNYSDTLQDYGVGSVLTANLTANPTFTNAGGSLLLATDYRISSGSAAESLGVDLSSTLTTDYEGTARVVPYDVGAFQLADESDVADGCATGSDTFNRTGTIGATWTRQNDTGGATAGRVAGIATASQVGVDVLYFCTTTRTADQYAEIVVDSSLSSTRYQGAGVRLAGTTATTFTGYVGFVTTTTWSIDRYVAGSSASLASGSTTVSAGNTIRLSVIGALLTLTKGGVSLGTTTDTLYTSGKAGIGLYSGTSGSVGIASFTSGDETPPGSPAATTPGMVSRSRFRR